MSMKESRGSKKTALPNNEYHFELPIQGLQALGHIIARVHLARSRNVAAQELSRNELAKSKEGNSENLPRS
jgi:hypothetical protein